MYISIPLPIRVSSSLCAQLHDVPLLTLQLEIERESGSGVLFSSPASIDSKSSFIQEGKGPGNEGRRMTATPSFVHPFLFSPLSPLGHPSRYICSYRYRYCCQNLSQRAILYKLSRVNFTSPIVLVALH